MVDVGNYIITNIYVGLIRGMVPRIPFKGYTPLLREGLDGVHFGARSRARLNPLDAKRFFHTLSALSAKNGVA